LGKGVGGMGSYDEGNCDLMQQYEEERLYGAGLAI
jgi:hypothetical protein